MGPADTKSEHTRLDGSTRLRVIDLATSSGTFPLGGGLACVLTPTSERTRIASEIAGAVIGPRTSDVNGTMEIAGRYVALHSLPTPLLGPRSAPTVDRALLEQVWRSSCMNHRAEIEVAHAARRLERHRSRAELERLHQPARVLPDRVAAMSEAEAAIGGPELAVLADRVATARRAAARNAGGVDPQARARIEGCHREVVSAERVVFEAKRKDRSDALTAYQGALAAEQNALSEAGADSYASFLVAIAQGAPRVDPEVRLRAELELAEAEAALDDARRQGGLDARGNPADAELELRMVELIRVCDEHDRVLAELEQELAEVDRVRSRDLADVDAPFVPRLVDALLDAYRSGDLLAGRLPLLVNGAFDGLDAGALADELARVDDVQVVVVTSDAVLAGALGRAGAARCGCRAAAAPDVESAERNASARFAPRADPR
jgi:hypothetical protein